MAFNLLSPWVEVGAAGVCASASTCGQQRRQRKAETRGKRASDSGRLGERCKATDIVASLSEDRIARSNEPAIERMSTNCSGRWQRFARTRAIWSINVSPHRAPGAVRASCARTHARRVALAQRGIACSDF